MSGAWSSSRAEVACDRCGQVWARDPALEVACPVCHVRVGAWCKNPSGHKAMHLHTARMQAAFDAGLEPPCPGETAPVGPPPPTVSQLPLFTMATPR